jgi:hypothetical protein
LIAHGRGIVLIVPTAILYGPCLPTAIPEAAACNSSRAPLAALRSTKVIGTKFEAPPLSCARMYTNRSAHHDITQPKCRRIELVAGTPTPPPERSPARPWRSSLGTITCVAVVGLKAVDFAGHGLRSGLCTSAAMAGASERSIMGQSGHKSERMLRRYINPGMAEDLGLSSFLDEKVLPSPFSRAFS